MAHAVIRSIQRVEKSRPTMEGAGVYLQRAFGFGQRVEMDPFLLLDDFRSTDPERYLPGFPWHPHRGIETITYMLDGSVAHGDSLGNHGVIGAGEVQWMTAGSGIIHQEMPKGDAAGRMGGFQLWANLPSGQKMTAPCYREIAAAAIPEVIGGDGVRIKIISGNVQGVPGAVNGIAIDPEYLDVIVPPQTVCTHRVQAGYTVFAYVISGVGYFDWQRQCRISAAHLVVFGDGDCIQATAEAAPLRFLLISGKPLREPIAWYGPIVMNTPEQLRSAFEEYRNGTFIPQGGMSFGQDSRCE